MSIIKKSLLATATAGLIAVGAIAVTTSAASAASGNDMVRFGGPGWSLQFGFGGGPQYHPQPVCQPIVKKVRWWDRGGYPHFTPVVVGNTCGANGPGPWNGPGQWNGPNQHPFNGGNGPGNGQGWHNW